MSTASPPQSSTPSLASVSTADHDTNSLILTSLSPSFFYPEVLDALHAHFSSYGHLHSWAPITAFGRIMMVYWHSEDAEQAKLECDGMVLADEDDRVITTPLRVYRGVHTDINEEVDRLPVPHTVKNFLISPPGSPPVGWEPAAEEPPNTAALAADLLAALQRLQLNRARPTDKPGVQLLMTPDDDDTDSLMSPLSPEAEPSTAAKIGLTVYLEDSDFKAEDFRDGSGTLTPVEQGLWQGERMHGGIGLVKASMASMRQDGHASPGGRLATPGAGKIARVPTPRPPQDPTAS
ncbi:carbohydrate-binding module 1 protein [Tulasnella sp. 331]|nr:carbohydrate-binding module 1 protein [Tulasnella sp. 331]KAG8888823.1 carbohydrate-binding module 1 protein [Tulasnella sp. 332]